MDDGFICASGLKLMNHYRSGSSVALVQPVPVGVSVFAANQWDEPDKAKNAPHERVRSCCHQDGRHDHVSRQEDRVEGRHEADGNPSIAWAALLSLASEQRHDFT